MSKDRETGIYKRRVDGAAPGFHELLDTWRDRAENVLFFAEAAEAGDWPDGWENVDKAELVLRARETLAWTSQTYRKLGRVMGHVDSRGVEGLLAVVEELAGVAALTGTVAERLMIAPIEPAVLEGQRVHADRSAGGRNKAYSLAEKARLRTAAEDAMTEAHRQLKERKEREGIRRKVKEKDVYRLAGYFLQERLDLWSKPKPPSESTIRNWLNANPE